LEALGKILVIRGGAIGDFILALPVLAALRRQFPLAALEVLGYPHIVQLALAGGLADHVRSIEARPLAGFFAPHATLDRELADYFAGFSLIISYLFDPDATFRVNVAKCSRAQFILGPHRPDEASNAHATDVFLQPLAKLGIINPDPIPQLRLNGGFASTASTKEVQRQNLSGGAAVLALHPGSGSERKNWPEEKWAEFASRLSDVSDCRFLLVGGEAEGDRLTRLSARLPSERVELAQSLPLVDLAFRLRQCRAFVGHDSGISHLAAALGVPVLVLWGNTNQAVWRPRGDRVKIVQSGGRLEELPVQRVIEELATNHFG